jgi:predicted metalloprotease with PDZ domain
MLMLSPFPRAVGAERWSAETRGGTVMLLSGQSPSKVAALAQLSSPLTHELFHLWVPNGLSLEGNYDWFYEGFTLYQALCAGVRLHFLTFQDYLNALARAYDAYHAASGRQQLSLLEASRRRWTGSTALVYQKGMLVAFLFDLSLRQASRGKRNLDDIYRALFQQTDAAGRDGNETVLALLKSQDEMLDFTRRYVESASEIDLPAALAPFGLRVERVGARTTISADGKLTRQQRDLWRAFGYNEDAQRAVRRVSS